MKEILPVKRKRDVMTKLTQQPEADLVVGQGGQLTPLARFGE